MYKKLIILLTAICGGCIGVPDPTSKMVTAEDKFAVGFQKAVHESLGGSKSTVSSPLSVEILLGLYSLATEGELKQELTNALGLGPSDADTVARYGSIADNLMADDKVLSLANKIYLLEGGKLAPEFESNAKKFKAELESINFSQRSNAADNINTWVTAKTNGKINKLIEAQDITEDTAAVLLNAIYFKGKWKTQFRKDDTQKKPFHISLKDTKQVDMMSLSGQKFKYGYNDQLKAQVLELPYATNPFRMVIVLPVEVEGLERVMSDLSVSGLRTALDSLSEYPQQVDVQIPKFEIESKLDLNGVLNKVGISKIFNVSTDKLVSGLPVKVSKVVQKAYIKVDEEGTEAAAATGVMLVALSWSPSQDPPLFKADRPFFYAVLKEDQPLFTGTQLE